VSFIGGSVSFVGQSSKETARLGESEALQISYTMLRKGNEL